MSAKGRGTVSHPQSWYPTWRWCVRRLLEEPELELPGGTWLEPAGGEGDLVREVLASRPDVTIEAVELRPVCRRHLEASGAARVTIGSYLDQAHSPRHAVILTNPPYHLAEPFVQHALESSAVVVMFVSLGFQTSARRNGWMRDCPPDVFVLPDRPSFRPDNKTDAEHYGWFVWPVRRHRRFGRTLALKTTSPAERQRDRMERESFRRLHAPDTDLSIVPSDRLKAKSIQRRHEIEVFELRN